MAAPNTVTSEHPIGGGGSPSYLGAPGGNVGFYQDPYGGGAVPQRASAFQQVITVSQTAGLMVVSHTNSQRTPALTAQNISSTAITLTGAPMLSSADVVVINKQVPLAQFGIANCRVSVASPAQNTLILTLGCANLNISGVSSTTPAGDVHLIAAFRGSIVNSVTLAPAVVNANTTMEQQFTVTGVAPGMVVPLTKPADQSGLGIAGTRVVSNNVLGVTFINTANTAITPTANEVYTYVGIAGAAPLSPIMTVGINMSQAPIMTITGQTVTYNTIMVTGVQGSDQVMGTGQNILNDAAQIFLAGARVSSASTNYMELAFVNMTVSTTPVSANSTDTWLIPMVRQNLEAPVTLYPATVPATSIGPNTCTEIAVTVTGITVSCAVFASKPSFTTGIGVLGYRVSAAATTGSTIGITFGNPTSATITVPAETYTVAAFKPQFGVGHYVQQLIGPLNVQGVALTNEMRNALAGTGFIAGG